MKIRNTHIAICLWVLIAGFFSPELSAQQPGAIAPREFEQQALEKYRSDPNYAYGKEPQPDDININPPDLSWLRFGKYLMYAVIGIVIVGLIVLLLRSLLGSRPQTLDAPGEESTEKISDIRSIDTASLITQAMEKGEYRLLVRLLYLDSLKSMASRNLIQWRPDKTNQDYRRELGRGDLRSQFDRLTLAYEYIWYGDHKPSLEDALRLKEAFFAFRSQFAQKS